MTPSKDHNSNFQSSMENYRKKELNLLLEERDLIQEQMSQLQRQLDLVEERIDTLQNDSGDANQNEQRSVSNQKHSTPQGKLSKSSSARSSTRRTPPSHNKKHHRSPLSSSPAAKENYYPSNDSTSHLIAEVVDYSQHHPSNMQEPEGYNSHTFSNEYSNTPVKQNSSTARTPKSRSSSSKQRRKKTPGSTSKVFERLTDPSHFTGTHKERFDAFGRGRGIAGRREFFPSGIPYDEVFRKDLPSFPTEKLREVEDDPATKVMIEHILKMDPDTLLTSRRSSYGNNSSQGSSRGHSRSSSRESIFEYLNDPSSFTGMYKARREELQQATNAQ